MTDNIELFPFPGQNDETKNNQADKPDLPVFPPDPDDPLSTSEITELRKIIRLFKKHADFSTLLQPQSTAKSDEKLPVFPEPEMIEPVLPPDSSLPEPQDANGWRRLSLKFFDGIQITEVWEVEARGAFKAILEETAADNTFVKLWGAIAGIFPLRKCLRHGTPEQRLFALIALSDRFLTTIAGEAFPARKKMLKTVASYFSAASDSYNFLAMENEPFQPQYHERAPGSSATGRTIREMHGFLVVARGSNQIVRTAMVLT